jgi:DNA polymerase-4
VGEATEEKLRALGLHTIGDVPRAGEAVLVSRLGRERALHLLALARGEDDRAVVPDRAPVSVGSEHTFAQDLRDREALVPHLLEQADRACARLRDLAMRARTITLKVKYADHSLITRRTTSARATSDGSVVGRLARELLAAVPAVESRGVRLTGVSLSGLEPRDAPRQLTLEGPASERGEQLGETIDAIAARFGHSAIRRAVHLDGGDDE